MKERLLRIAETSVTIGVSVSAAMYSARATKWAFEQLRKRLDS